MIRSVAIYQVSNSSLTMKNIIIISIIVVSSLLSCHYRNEEDSMAKWRAEIEETERDFARMAGNDGLEKAFLTYAADDAVLMRNNVLIIGKESIRERFQRQKHGTGSVTLFWEPDFVDVSASGDLGYTFGRYTATITDSLGNIQLDSGIFHTVWKRQPDGNWRYVWD